MHIFLTGDIQVGKSTIIDKVLERTGMRAGGFRTGFSEERFTASEKYLYMRSADKPLEADMDHAIAFMKNYDRKPFPEAFDRLGTAYIEAAFRSGADIIIADECGFLERDAMKFQKAVLDALDGEIPVLGAVRKGFPGWTASIAGHPGVRIIEVTIDNRNALADELSEYFAGLMKRR